MRGSRPYEPSSRYRGAGKRVSAALAESDRHEENISSRLVLPPSKTRLLDLSFSRSVYAGPLKEPDHFFRSAFAWLLAFQIKRHVASAGISFASAFGQKKVGTPHDSIEFEATQPVFLNNNREVRVRTRTTPSETLTP